MANLAELLKQRILVLDGAMGSMIQTYKLDEAQYRGERFKDWPCDVKGNNDLLVLSQPQIIKDIHKAYLEAGADIIETNTFNANVISMADYEMEALVYEMNVAAAKLAKAACDEFSTDGKPRLVAGVLGPTNRTASISPDVNNPGFRNVTFEQLSDAYTEALRGLIDGGTDIILVETIFDTLNAKAAIFAVQMGLVRYLNSLDLHPDVVLGHSVGQYAAACVADVMSWEEGLRLIHEQVGVS